MPVIVLVIFALNKIFIILFLKDFGYSSISLFSEYNMDLLSNASYMFIEILEYDMLITLIMAVPVGLFLKNRGVAV
jgi:hypothetical protein